MSLNNLIKYISKYNCSTNVYGLARSILAFSLILTLFFNKIDYLISFDIFPEHTYQNRFLLKYSFFYLFKENILLAKYVAISVLFIVLIGWKPRYTVILHWWITFSFYSFCPVIDGGDQIASILTFFIIPFGLFDNREWHWNKQQSIGNPFINILNFGFYSSIRIQACVIYLFAFSEKTSVSEWKNGTVLYYWFSDPIFGANDFIFKMIEPILKSSFIGVFTWGVLLLEVVLAMGIIANKKYWKFLLLMGISFHFCIWIIHGLFSFFLTMTALLILYFRPLNYPFNFTFIKKNYEQ